MISLACLRWVELSGRSLVPVAQVLLSEAPESAPDPDRKGRRAPRSEVPVQCRKLLRSFRGRVSRSKQRGTITESVRVRRATATPRPPMLFVFIFGCRPLGWCDYQEHRGQRVCIATWFFHILFLPLIPIKSYIVVAPRGACDGRVAIVKAIPLSCKSVGIAWLRFLALGMLWSWEPCAREESAFLWDSTAAQAPPEVLRSETPTQVADGEPLPSHRTTGF